MATKHVTHEKLTLAAVNATPMDGVTTGQLFTDIVAAQVVELADPSMQAVKYDNASIIGMATGDPGDTALFNMYRQPSNFDDNQVSPAQFIGQVTGTLGTAKASDTERFFDTFTGDLSFHPLNVAIKDVGNDRICSIVLDPIGSWKLIFEPITFTGLTDISFIVNEFGFDN